MFDLLFLMTKNRIMWLNLHIYYTS